MKTTARLVAFLVLAAVSSSLAGCWWREDHGSRDPHQDHRDHHDEEHHP